MHCFWLQKNFFTQYKPQKGQTACLYKTGVLYLNSVNKVTVKPVFFACPLFREFREPGKFAKITGSENLNTVAFQCSRKQKRQNYRVQNNYIDSNAKIKGGQN